MELKEAIEILKNTYYYPTEMKRTQEAVETVLKVLDMPEEEVVFYGTRTCGKTYKRTYEMGLIVGTKRERVHWENKIKEKIKEVDSRECDDLFDRECDDLFELQAFMYEQAVIIEELEELLKGE